MNHTASTHRAALCGPAFCLAILLVVSTQAAASGIQVSPTRIQLGGEHRVEAITLSNDSAREISFQLELMEWSQEDNQDHYETTTELLATPPIFTLPAGESRIVRVGLRRAPDPEHELSYRLFVEELPRSMPDDFTGLQMLLRMALPIFIAPATGQADHQLNWQARLNDSGEVEVEIQNHGNAHAQITDLRIDNATTGNIASGMFYVLPGATRTRHLAASSGLSAGHPIELSARINGQPVTTRMQLD